MEGLKKNIFFAVSLTVKIPFSRTSLKTLCSSGNCQTCSWSAWQSPIYSLPSSSCPLPSSMICRFPFMYSSLLCQGFIAIVWYITWKYAYTYIFIFSTHQAAGFSNWPSSTSELRRKTDFSQPELAATLWNSLSRGASCWLIGLFSFQYRIRQWQSRSALYFHHYISSGNIFHKISIIFYFARDTGGWVTQPVSFGSGGVSTSTLLYYFSWDVEI